MCSGPRGPVDKNISGVDSRGPFPPVKIFFKNTPIARAFRSYTTHNFLEFSVDIFDYSRDYAAVSLLKPPRGGFRSETATSYPFQK